MKVLLNTFGTAGDNLPVLALGRALQAQGHDVVLALNPAWVPRAEAAGLRAFPAGPRWDVDETSQAEKYLHPTRGGIAIWRDICLPNIAPTYRAIAEHLARERPDVVVAHFLCVGAQWAARAAGVPVAVATPAPCWWYSSRIPPSFLPNRPPAWLHARTMWIARAMTNRSIGAPLEPFCRELGVRFSRDVYFRIFSEASLNLGLWSPALRPAADDDPPRSRICGFPSTGGTPPLEPRVAAFLDAGPAPIVVGLGTSARLVAPTLLPRMAEACARVGRRALLVGAELQTPPDALAVRAAPFSATFPRAAAIVHHGGIGTTAEALRARRPAVIAPFSGDQHDNALLCERLGVSTTLPPGRRPVEAIVAALRRVLDGPAFAQRAAAAPFAAEEDGALVAARVLSERFGAAAEWNP